MINRIKELITEIEKFSSADSDAIEAFRIKYLSKKGIIPQLFGEFKNVAQEQKKEFGQLLNQLKNNAQDKVELLKREVSSSTQSDIKVDASLPGNAVKLGTRHPVTQTRNQIVDIFQRLGFTISESLEIEDDWHVFSSLNFPKEHPARDMQDTFFVERNPDVLLRTHTSSVQARVMETTKPPIRVITPGRVFRNEAISARAHCIFHQVEGLYIDKDVSFADLRQTLDYFIRELFGKEVRTRLRPSYFPFTEPSAELDIECLLCKGKGCNVCKHTSWLEVLGCGMVDVNVLKANNIDPDVYTGFAFGMGIERITMLKYGVNDLRLYFENDLRFLRQF